MRDACAIVGALSVSTGAGLIALPAGLIVFGSLLLVAGLYGHFRGTPHGPA